MPNKTRRDEYSGGFPDGFEPFGELEDLHSGRDPRHYFGEIIFIALAAMVCAARASTTSSASPKPGSRGCANASSCHLTLGQLAVDGKSNEITAVPELIDRLDLEGHSVSLDAVGYQKTIARKLSLAHADYLLALKANHGALYQRAEEFFRRPHRLREP